MLDAMLGLFVLVVGVFLIMSSYLNVQQPLQVGLISDDLMAYLSNTKIKNLNNPYGGLGGELWRNGNITDRDNTLLQQAGEFYATKHYDVAENFIRNVSENVVPSQFKYEVWIDDFRIYPQILAIQDAYSRGNTTLMLTSKKITFGILNRTTSSTWGPYKAEVFVWQR